MTDHAQEAERCEEAAARQLGRWEEMGWGDETSPQTLQAAQVFATLALSHRTAEQTEKLSGEIAEVHHRG